LVLVLHDAWFPAVHKKAEGALFPLARVWLVRWFTRGRRGAHSVRTCENSLQGVTAKRCGDCSRNWQRTVV
jgi:hypothetical protein